MIFNSDMHSVAAYQNIAYVACFGALIIIMDHQQVNRLSMTCVIIMMITTIAGASVMLSPPEIAPVCSGDKLELTYSNTRKSS